MRNKTFWFATLCAFVFSIVQAKTLPANPALQEVSELKQITYHKAGGQLEADIKIQGKFGFEIVELRTPNRLVIDLSSVKKISSQSFLQINDVGVLTVRVGQFQPEIARVVFDFDEKSPLHRISRVEEGLKVIFWSEGAPAPAQTAAAPAKAEVKELEKKETLREAGETKVAPEKKAPEAFKKQAPETGERVRGFFIRVGGGVQLPLGSTTQVQKDLNLYGEAGSIKESYKLAVSSAVELGCGSYFRIGGREIKAGIELGYSQFNYKGTVDLSLPHPFIPNNPRTVTSEENLKDKLYSFIIYGLYPVIGGEKFNLYLGPALGFASGKYLSLQDFSITDNPPYGNSDVTVTNKIHIEDSISGLMLGGQASLEYLITQSLSLNLDGRVIYLSPKVKNLAMNASFSQVQLVLGLGYNF